MQPDPRVLPLFAEIVRDLWTEERSLEDAEARQLARRIEDREKVRERLLNALLRGAVDDETYRQHDEKLRKETAEAESQRIGIRSDEPDVEVVIAFAAEVMSDLAGYWNRAEPSAKTALQRVVYPGGLTFDGERLGTAVTSPVFSYLQGFTDQKNKLAALTGFEPVSPP